MLQSLIDEHPDTEATRESIAEIRRTIEVQGTMLGEKAER